MLMLSVMGRSGFRSLGSGGGLQHVSSSSCRLQFTGLHKRVIVTPTVYPRLVELINLPALG